MPLQACEPIPVKNLCFRTIDCKIERLQHTLIDVSWSTSLETNSALVTIDLEAGLGTGFWAIGSKNLIMCVDVDQLCSLWFENVDFSQVLLHRLGVVQMWALEQAQIEAQSAVIRAEF